MIIVLLRQACNGSLGAVAAPKVLPARDTCAAISVQTLGGDEPPRAIALRRRSSLAGCGVQSLQHHRTAQRRGGVD